MFDISNPLCIIIHTVDFVHSPSLFALIARYYTTTFLFCLSLSIYFTYLLLDSDRKTSLSCFTLATSSSKLSSFISNSSQNPSSSLQLRCRPYPCISSARASSYDTCSTDSVLTKLPWSVAASSSSFLLSRSCCRTKGFCTTCLK